MAKNVPNIASNRLGFSYINEHDSIKSHLITLLCAFENRRSRIAANILPHKPYHVTASAT